MKVLQINGVCNSGSTGKIVLGIERVLQAEGHESLVAYSGNHEKIENMSNRYRIASYMRVKKHQLLGFVFGDAGFHSKRETKKLIKYIETEQPNIVHLHNIYSYYLNVELLLTYLAKKEIPVVYTIHDCWPITGHCTHFVSVDCKKWKNICFDCPLKRSYPSAFVDRTRELFLKKKALYDRFSNLNIVCVSNWLKDIVLKSILGTFPVHIIYNGINLSKYRTVPVNDYKKKFGIEEKFLILGVSNGWGVHKGLAYFIKLANQIGPDAQIMLVGLSEEQRKLMPLNIIGLPKIQKEEDLIDIYASADTFVSFSTQETMGMVVVESMACGTPAIVMPYTASPELITSNCGFVNQSGTIEECLEYIDVIRQRGKRYYTPGCVDRVRENFSDKVNYKRYVDLYEEVIEA